MWNRNVCNISSSHFQRKFEMQTSSEVHNEWERRLWARILFPKAPDRWIKLIITLLKRAIVLGGMILPSLLIDYQRIVSLNSGWRCWVSATVSWASWYKMALHVNRDHTSFRYESWFGEIKYLVNKNRYYVVGVVRIPTVLVNEVTVSNFPVSVINPLKQHLTNSILECNAM